MNLNPDLGPALKNFEIIESKDFRYSVSGATINVKEFLILLLNETKSTIGSYVPDDYINEIFSSNKSSEQFTFGGLRFYITVGQESSSFDVWPNSGGDTRITAHSGPILKEAIEKIK